MKGVSIPVAVSIFPGEQYQAPRSWTERAYPNLIYFNEVDKGDSAADEWLPKDPDQQCSYVIIQVVIKTLYHLAVTKAERGAFVEVLTAQDCEGGTWPLLDRSDFKVPKPKPIGEPKPKPVKKPVKRSEPARYYKNCDAVRAAGKAPIHRGDPGYARHLDRDGDGVGCEWS